jgi:hypothetical protein
MCELVDNNTIERHGKGTSNKSLRIRQRRERMFKEQGGICHWCKRPMELIHLKITPKGYVKNNGGFATFEHLIPRAKGGKKLGKANIVLAHATCNRNRHRMKWAHDPIYGKLLP